MFLKIHNNVGKDTVYRFDFHYADNNGNIIKEFATMKKGEVDPREITECVISEKIGEKQYKPIATGRSVRNLNDPFRRSTGRRVSLKNALKDMKENYPKLSKSFNKLVWEQYLITHRDGKNVKLSI